ncbi:zinc finger X-chromosomal protein-like [Ostrea edulis]|uniref:zinc finger X-chromosomal protein-like n=1 Tax=Ostrea edulis TaxID=37623 RepID=UPI00209565E1|nr:zinc finger X-chromosomal protein-like [Ostrea edulis]
MRPEISVSVPDMATKLTNVLFYYQQNQILCDCRIQCCDGEVYAHKIVLAMWGLYSFYIDSINAIQALEFSSVHVNKFIKLIYCGKILLTLEEALDMSSFGNHIGIKLKGCVSSDSCSTANTSIEDSLESVIADFMSSKNPMVKSNSLHIRFEPSYNWNILTLAKLRCEEPCVEAVIFSSSDSIAGAQNFPDSAVTMVTDVKIKDEEEDLDVCDVNYSVERNEGSSGESLIASSNDGTQHDKKHERDQMLMNFNAEMLESSKGVDFNEENVNSSYDCKESTCHGDELKTFSNSKGHSDSANSKRHSDSANSKSQSDSAKVICGKVKTKESRSNFRKCKHCLKMKVENPFVYRYDTTEGKDQIKLHSLQSHDLAIVRNVSCDICGIVYKRCYSETYVDHKFRKHGCAEYDPVIFTKKVCDSENCKFWALCRIKLKVHKAKVHATESVVCNICGAVMKHVDTLRSHLQMKHRSQHIHQCEFCGKTLSTANSLKNHIELVHEKKARKPGGFCSYCTQSFKTRYMYLVHMHREHKEIPPGTKVHRCHECDYLAFDKKLLKGHELRHKALKGHVIEKDKQCDICEKRFVTRRNLTDHVRRTHGIKIHCPYEGCSKTFPGNTNLKIHITCFHEREKKFGCHACPYKCTSHGNLVKHIRGVHKEEVSTLHTRRIQAMLSGRGYLEATNTRLTTGDGHRGEGGAPTTGDGHRGEGGAPTTGDGHRGEGGAPTTGDGHRGEGGTPTTGDGHGGGRSSHYW